MTGSPQKRALKNYRKRMAARGLLRFEVLALRDDKVLIRSLAKQLTKNDSEAQSLRDAVRQRIKRSPTKGGILMALLRSPLAGADLDLSRENVPPREIDL